MKSLRKITIHVPEKLLSKAQSVTGTDVAGTVRRGLELLAATKAFAELRSLRGKIEFSTALSKLRED